MWQPVLRPRANNPRRSEADSRAGAKAIAELTVKETNIKSQMSIGIEKVPMGIFFDLKSVRKSGGEWSCGEKSNR